MNHILNEVIVKLYYDGHEKIVERIGLLGIEICKENYERPLVFSIKIEKDGYIRLPVEQKKVEIEVAWGDSKDEPEAAESGSETAFKQSLFNKFMYTYKTGGKKTIRVFKNGKGVERFGYIGGIASTKPWTKNLLEFRTLGSIGIKSLEGCFAFLDKKIGLSHLETSEIVNLNSCFIKSKWTGNLDGWVTSRVEDIAYMFMYSDFDNSSIEAWDTSKVVSTRQLFFECPRGDTNTFIPSIDYNLRKWDLDVSLKSELYAPFYGVKF